MKFKTFDLHPAITAGAIAAGYVTPTPIQAQAMPHVLNQKDVMGLAQTGTGKTAAFVLPILNRLMGGETWLHPRPDHSSHTRISRTDSSGNRNSGAKNPLKKCGCLRRWGD